MKKRITALILVVLMVIIGSDFSNHTNKAIAIEPDVEFYRIEEIQEDAGEGLENEEDFSVERIKAFYDAKLLTYSLEELEILIDEAQTDQEAAHNLAESARQLGWPEDSESIVSAKAEWWNAQLAIELYDSRYQELCAELEETKWDIRKKEYPEATEIWLYMKNLGWNDYICAGIMGNLMAEVGGGTLEIRYWLYDSDKAYYGMCQWSEGYSAIWGAGLFEQCNFLRDTIKYELDTFGYAYAKGFNFNAFLNMTNERDAAKAFAKCYERCASSTYKIRQNNAEKAYNYFVND